MEPATTTTPTNRMRDLLEALDQHGAVEVAARHGQRDPELAHAYLCGLLTAYARDLLAADRT